MCIDQSNQEERGSQIKLMSQIYKLAHRVVVWLGPNTESSAVAMQILRHLGSQVEISKVLSIRSPEVSEPGWVSPKTSLPFSQKDWQSVQQLLAHSWFERLWIWQEIAAANSRALIVCGVSEIQWIYLRKAIVYLLYRNVTLPTGLRARLKFLETLAVSDDDFDEGLLLTHSRQRKCQDPKNHIYGILSMCRLDLARKISPDYSLDVEYARIFQDFFLHLIDMTSNMDFLRLCDELTRAHDGPSWVPNLSVPGKCDMGQIFQLPSGLSASEAFQVEAATVSLIAQRFPATDEEVKRTWKDQEPTDLLKKSYPSGGIMLDAYCTTLQLGRLRDRFPMSNSSSLEHWKARCLSLISSIHDLQASNLLDPNRSDDEVGYNPFEQLRYLRLTTATSVSGPRPYGQAIKSAVCSAAEVS